MSSLIDTIHQSIAKISKRNHLPHDYVVTIEQEESLATHDGNLVDIRLEAGNPPKLIIPFMFVARCFLLDKKDPQLWEKRIQAALEKYERMRRTLINPIDRDLALILKSTEKKWMRTHGITESGTVIFKDDEFDIEYVAIVTDKITKKSFTINGPDPYKCKDEAKARLTKIFMADAELMDFRDAVLGMQDSSITVKVKEAQPKVILLQTNVDNERDIREQTNERREY